MIIVLESLSIFFFILAAIIMKVFCKSIHFAGHYAIQSKHNKAHAENKFIIILVMGITFLSIILYFIWGNFNRSGALSELINLILSKNIYESVDVSQYRDKVYHTGGFSLIFGNYISSIILPIISMFFIIEGRKQNKTFLKAFGVLILCITIIFSIGTGSRLMTMKIILYVLIVFSLIYKVKTKTVILIVFTVFMLLLLTTVLLGRGGSKVKGFGANIARNSERALSRVMLGKGAATLLVYEYYPHIEDYEYGSTMVTALSGYLSDEKTLAMKMHEYKYGVRGTAGPQTFGDLYANFGPLAQGIMSFSLGLFFPLIYLIALKKKYWGSFDLAFIAYIFFDLGYMGYSDAITFKSSGLHIVLVCYMLYGFVKPLFNVKSGYAFVNP